MKRIGVIQIIQESNTFNPVCSSFKDFEVFGIGTGKGVIEKFADVDEIGGFLKGLKSWQEAVEPVGLLRCQAWPGGPLSEETEKWLLETITRELQSAGKLDGVLFALHGALVAENESDADGLLLEEVRNLIGRDIPMVVTIDLHAYCTTRMMHAADAIVAYHTSPHMDREQTGERAAFVLEKIMKAGRPEYSAVKLPMISISEAQDTFGPVLAPIFEKVKHLESNPEILSAAVLMTQGWLDVPQLGWSVLIITHNNKLYGDEKVLELANMCWQRRERLTEQFYSAEESVSKALACSGKPVVIADGADATNSGAGGDSTHLLKAMINNNIPEHGLLIMVDPDAVHHAVTAGEGSSFCFAVGGKRDHVFSTPLPVNGTVKSIQPARYVLSGHGGQNLAVNMGISAIVDINDVTLLLVENPGPGSTPQMYRCVGLEPRDFKIVVVKSPTGFRAEFETFAADIILADCPGCASPHYAKLPYHAINRPLWPLDEIDDWRNVPWIRKGLPLPQSSPSEGVGWVHREKRMEDVR